MSEREKNALKELFQNFKKLREADKIRITGIAEGMVIARESIEKLKPTDKKTEDTEETKND